MKFKVKPTDRVVNFKCELDCGGQCCTGLSLALPAEVKYLYDKVPLVLTLEAMDLNIVRNHPKLSRQAYRFMPKITMLEDNGDYIGDLCVFFDFAMGAWHSEKFCFLLKDGKCTVHGEHKPLKCKLLPIQPLSDERVMYKLYEKMRSYCPGVKNMTEKGCCVYKDGKLCNKDDVKNLQAYYDTAAQTSKFNEDYFRFLWALKDGAIIEQVKDSYLKELEREDYAFPLSFEVPFFPMDIFLDQLGIEVKDYVDKQLNVMEEFKEYDPEGFEKSFIKRQYAILKAAKEAGYRPKA